MKGKLRLAGILAVLVLLLGGLATWDEWKTKKEQEDEKTKNKLAEFKPEEVLELDYFSKAATSDEANGEKPDDNPKQDAVQVTAVKKDGLWRLTKPIDALADSATIEGLVNTLHDYAYAKVITDKREGWGEYGLLEPKRHISLRLGGNTPRTITVYLGSKAPVGYNAYLRTSLDDRVLLGGQHILVSTSKSLDDFRDRTLVRINEGKIKNLDYLAQGAAPIELTKADGKYQIVQPEKLDADSIATREFIEGLNQMKVAGFIDAPDDATKALFNQPSLVVSWQEETGEKSALKVVDRGGKLLAAFDPSQRVYALPEDFKAKVKKELIDFRNRRILEPDALDAKAVEIDGEVFKNIEGNWYAAADAAKFDDKGKFKGAEPDKPQEKPHVRALMVDLEFAKTDRFIALDDPLAKALPAAPLHRLVLSYFDQSKKPISIDLYKDADATRYLVKRTGSPFVYRVNTSAFNSMTASKEPALKGAGPTDPEEMDVQPPLDLDEGPNGTDNAAVPKSKDAGLAR